MGLSTSSPNRTAREKTPNKSFIVLPFPAVSARRVQSVDERRLLKVFATLRYIGGILFSRPFQRAEATTTRATSCKEEATTLRCPTYKATMKNVTT